MKDPIIRRIITALPPRWVTACVSTVLFFGALSTDGAGLMLAAADSKPPADDAPVAVRWSFGPARPPASKLENPWRAATLSPALDRYLVDKGAAVATRLTAAQDDRGSTCESLLFRVPKSGWYRAMTAGKLLGLSQPTAGFARVNLFVIGHGGRETTKLASFPLNTPGGYRGHPQQRPQWEVSARRTADNQAGHQATRGFCRDSKRWRGKDGWRSSTPRYIRSSRVSAEETGAAASGTGNLQTPLLHRCGARIPEAIRKRVPDHQRRC